MSDIIKCPVCKSQISMAPNRQGSFAFYECPLCGRYELLINRVGNRNYNQLAPYLYYNRFIASDETECRYHTELNIELCDRYNTSFANGLNERALPVHMDAEVVENWYPKTFAERVDRILVRLFELTKHIGQGINFERNELLSLLFVDREENGTDRAESDCVAEAFFMRDYLVSEKYITKFGDTFTLAPNGYARVDMLQKDKSRGKKVFVAMQFGDETKMLREAIRSGARKAGYAEIFIDELPHNNYIVPEILKKIRDSKFVIVDLTHHNNGAYFEEGYAIGLGKPVIQLCREGVKMHFDAAQKNTLIWKQEDDIPEMLANRIRATIE